VKDQEFTPLVRRVLRRIDEYETRKANRRRQLRRAAVSAIVLVGAVGVGMIIRSSIQSRGGGESTTISDTAGTPPGGALPLFEWIEREKSAVEREIVRNTPAGISPDLPELSGDFRELAQGLLATEDTLQLRWLLYRIAEADPETQAALQSVVAQSLAHPEDGVRAAAFAAVVGSLQGSPDPSLDALVVELLSGSEIELRHATAYMMAAKRRDLASHLMPFLTGNDRDRKRIGIVALGQLRHAPALPVLLDLFDRADDEPSRVLLATALYELGHPAGRETLLQMAAGPDTADRGAALIRLARLNDPDTRTIAERLVASSDLSTASIAAMVLGDLRAPIPEQALLTLLERADPEDIFYSRFRFEIAYALVAAGHLEHEEVLLEQLTDRAASKRHMAVQRLRALDPARYAKHVIPLLQDPVSLVRIEAERLVAEAGTEGG